MTDKAIERARALRYKRSALAAMGYEIIMSELQEIYDTCSDLQWCEDDITQPVIDGDEDEGAGYRMDFSELATDAERLLDAFYSADCEHFDDCTVGLIGDRFACIGYDSIECDYYALSAFDAGRAQRESCKRIMRLTKAEMLTEIGKAVGMMMAFYDLRQRFDYLRAALSAVMEHNLETLRTVRSIEDAYAAWCDDGCRDYGDKYRRLHALAESLDAVYWVQ
jgi:hypothetical protein